MKKRFLKSICFFSLLFIFCLSECDAGENFLKLQEDIVGKNESETETESESETETKSEEEKEPDVKVTIYRMTAEEAAEFYDFSDEEIEQMNAFIELVEKGLEY